MLISALIFGLIGSFHCVGMCGPIAFMLPVDRDSPIKKALQILSYHLGRLFTYSLMGILFGYLGKGFFLFGFQHQIEAAYIFFPIITNSKSCSAQRRNAN